MDLLLNEEQEYGLIILSSKSGQSGIANHIMHPETIKKYYLININEINQRVILTLYWLFIIQTNERLTRLEHAM